MKRRYGTLFAIMFFMVNSLPSVYASSVEEDVLPADGDRQVVPFSQWLRDLTGNRSGIVYTTNDWSGFSLPRTWTKGQTVGQALKSARLFTGRFDIHFLDEAITLTPVTDHEDLPKIDVRTPRKQIFSEGDVVFTLGIHSSSYTPKVAQSEFPDSASGYPYSSGISGVGGASFFNHFDVFVSDRISIGFLVRSSYYDVEIRTAIDSTAQYLHANANPMLLMFTGTWHLAPTDWIDIGLGLAFGGVPPYGGENADYIGRELDQGTTFSYTWLDLSHWAIAGFRLSVTLRIYRDLLVTLDWLNTLYLDTMRFEGFVNSVGISKSLRFELW